MTVEGKGFVFREVVEFKGVPKDIIYTNLLTRAIQSFSTDRKDFDIEDKELGSIFFKAVDDDLVYKNVTSKMDGGQFDFEVSIEVKDGRARFTYSGIRHSGGEMVQMIDGSLYEEEFPSTWGKFIFIKKQSKKEWGKMKEQFRITLFAIHKKFAAKIVIDDGF